MQLFNDTSCLLVRDMEAFYEVKEAFVMSQNDNKENMSPDDK